MIEAVTPLDAEIKGDTRRATSKIKEKRHVASYALGNNWLQVELFYEWEFAIDIILIAIRGHLPSSYTCCWLFFIIIHIILKNTGFTACMSRSAKHLFTLCPNMVMAAIISIQILFCLSYAYSSMHQVLVCMKTRRKVYSLHIN